MNKDPSQKNSFDAVESLLAQAKEVAKAAYAPYSKFRVGAAVIMDGEIFRGVNVENAAYGGTICAERSAIVAGVSAGCRKLEAVAVACIDATDHRPSAGTPCGACRQFIAEFAHANTPVIVAVPGVGKGARFTLGELLPHSFSL
jgi:cytidine deaminase